MTDSMLVVLVMTALITIHVSRSIYALSAVIGTVKIAANAAARSFVQTMHSLFVEICYCHHMYVMAARHGNRVTQYNYIIVLKTLTGDTRRFFLSQDQAST